MRDKARPLRVALVSDWCLPRRGGIETQLVQLGQALGRAGVEARIVTSYPGPALVDGVATERIDCARLPRLDLAVPPKLVEGVRRHLREGAYDVVHVHPSIAAPFCLAGVLAGRSLRLPLVVTAHSVLQRPVLAGLAAALGLLDRAIGWTRWNLRLTAVSERVAGQLRSIARGLPVAVLPNGFDRSAWEIARPSARPPGLDLRLVSTMRLEPRKRPLALIDAVAAAESRLAREGIGLSLLIAGEGRLRPRLERRVASGRLAGSVSLPGWLSPDALRAVYAQADLFVMPSRKESFCIAALEARAAGLPVLAMHGTGIGEYIEDGVTGVIAADDLALGEAILALGLDPARRRALAAACPPLERYDWPNLAAEHIRLYRDVLSAAGADR